MRMVSIASGSSGNCIYIGSDNTHVLVDAGISNKRIEMGLNDLGLNARELDGILITHEHSDHIKGLGVLARKYGTPIYSTKETLEEIQDSKSLGEIPDVPPARSAHHPRKSPSHHWCADRCSGGAGCAILHYTGLPVMCDRSSAG